MSNDYKARAQKSLDKFFTKEMKKNDPLKKRRKNQKPEKQVQVECVQYMRSLGWQIEIYEAKATWNPKANAWTNSHMKAGTCDCMGLMPSGQSVAIEFKAPGKLSTFNAPKNYKQKEFILQRIKLNAFACVVDSLDRLRQTYIKWEELKNQGTVSAQQYLLNQLP